MKLRDAIGLIDQGMASKYAYPADKWVVAYHQVPDRHPPDRKIPGCSSVYGRDVESPPVRGGQGGLWVKLPPSWKWQGGTRSPPKLPPLQGGTISAEGGDRGGPVNFKVLEDSDDSPP